MEIKDLKLEDLKALRPDLCEALHSEALAGLEESIAAAESALAAKPEAPAAEPKPADNNGLLEANARIEALEKQNRVLRGAQIVNAALAASGLSESARALMAAEFEGAEAADDLEARVTARIEAFKAYEKGVVESVRVPGLPGIAATGGGDFDMSKEMESLFGPPAKPEKPAQ